MPESPEKEVLNNLFNEENQKYDVSIESEPEVDKKVESLVEKVEREIYMSKPITDDGGQPIASSIVKPPPTIILPVTKTAYDFGLKQKIEDSIRWLSVWCQKIMKIFGSRVTFKEEKQTV